MAEKITPQTMRCPCCGAPLKTSNPREATECLYCGNTVVPMADTSSTPHETKASGIVKIEGIKTPDSALAHIEILFEEYDWEDFYYSHSMSIPEMDDLVDYLRNTSADSKVTWIASAMVCAVPFLKKAEGCGLLLDKIADAHAANDLDAYSLFDAYSRIVLSIRASKNTITQNLQRYKGYAAKYGADAADLALFDNYLSQIQDAARYESYNALEDIPAVAELIRQKDIRVANDLAAAGINAAEVYANAQSMLSQGKYVNALNLLRVVQEYSNTKKLIKATDKYFLLDDVLEICHKLYYFVKQEEGYCLYAVEDKAIANKPLIKNIGNIITNYADTLYYLDNNFRLRKFNFADGTNELLAKLHFAKEIMLVRNWHCYLMSECSVYDLNLSSGSLTMMLENVDGTPKIDGQYMIYTSYDSKNNTRNQVIYDLDTRHVTILHSNACTIRGFAKNTVFFTTNTPNANNQMLLRQDLNDSNSYLVESNIFSFCGIYGDKLFYYVGNPNNRCLISTNLDGSDRTEWMRNITELLRFQGGWLYFIRRSGYNSVLCRARMDGSRYRIIASDIASFVETKNGYLYYLNDDNDLMKVRMDGAHSQLLRSDVRNVLQVKDDQIVFASSDGYTTYNTIEGITKRDLILSLYSVDFSGSGIRKLVYDITHAKTYDEDTIYYLAEQKVPNAAYAKRTALYSLNLLTRNITHLMDLNPVEPPKKGCLPFILLLLLAVILLGISIPAEMPFLIFLSIVLGVIALFGGIGRLDK